MITDFKETEAAHVEKILLKLGFVKLQLPTSYTIDNFNWDTIQQYAQRMPQKYRYNLKKEILPFANEFTIAYGPMERTKELKLAYELYKNVSNKSYQMNVFQLPFALFKAMNKNDEYEFIRLYLNGQLVGVLANHIGNKTYSALLVGLDYDYVYSHNSYKQILFQALLRAKELACTKLDLAFTAGMIKKKIGAKEQDLYAFVQSNSQLQDQLLNFV